MRTHELTSVRYHRAGSPPRLRAYGQNQQTTDIRDLYNGLSNTTAQQLGRFQMSPMTRFLGFGPQEGTRRARRMDEHLEGASGPLAAAIRDIRGLAPGIGEQATAAGSRISELGESMFGRLNDQISGALRDLPGFQAYSGRAAQLAARNAEEAFDPLGGEDIYQNAARRMTDSARPGFAARGLEGGGGAGVAESDALRQLTLEIAGQQRASRIPAIQASQGAAQNAAGLSAAGVPLAQAGMEAVNPLMQYLQSEYGMPLQALGGLLQMLTSGQAPALGLTQATGPIATNESKGFNII